MRLAIVFPGQGFQSVGMFNEGLEDSLTRHYIEQAQDYFHQPWTQWLVHGPQDILNQTQNTQPIVLTTSYALYRSYLSKGGPEPEMIAGHSLGEWTGLLAAHAFSFEDALYLVRQRAVAMQKSVQSQLTGMRAVMGLDSEIVIHACYEASKALGQVVEAVNFNSPRQTVIAGHLEALDHVTAILKTKGARRVIALPVSGAFHSALMCSAQQDISKALEQVDFHLPQCPVVQNVSASEYHHVSEIKAALTQQVCRPVQWVKTIEYFQEKGITHILECAPKKVLSGLIRQIAPELKLLHFGSPRHEVDWDQ